MEQETVSVADLTITLLFVGAFYALFGFAVGVVSFYFWRWMASRSNMPVSLRPDTAGTFVVWGIILAVVFMLFGTPPLLAAVMGFSWVGGRNLAYSLLSHKA